MYLKLYKQRKTKTKCIYHNNYKSRAPYKIDMMKEALIVISKYFVIPTKDIHTT